MLLTTFFVLVCIALICEVIDSGLGMMYGTIGTPILLIMGYEPTVVIPTILVSQGLGGLIASIGHHKHKNANLMDTTSSDFKASAIVYGLGVVAVVIGACVGNMIPKMILKTYIGILVVFMGLVVVLKGRFSFSWAKITGISFISAFNKAMSGGGYGPLMTNGLIASGMKSKSSIAITDFSEIFICVAAFIAWAIVKGRFDTTILLPICIGAAVGAAIGPYALSKIKSEKVIVAVVGYLAIILGVWSLLNPTIKI